jgi:chromosome segregation ATPase
MPKDELTREEILEANKRLSERLRRLQEEKAALMEQMLKSVPPGERTAAAADIFSYLRRVSETRTLLEGELRKRIEEADSYLKQAQKLERRITNLKDALKTADVRAQEQSEIANVVGKENAGLRTKIAELESALAQGPSAKSAREISRLEEALADVAAQRSAAEDQCLRTQETFDAYKRESTRELDGLKAQIAEMDQKIAELSVVSGENRPRAFQLLKELDEVKRARDLLAQRYKQVTEQHRELDKEYKALQARHKALVATRDNYARLEADLRSQLEQLEGISSGFQAQAKLEEVKRRTAEENLKEREAYVSQLEEELGEARAIAKADLYLRKIQVLQREDFTVEDMKSTPLAGDPVSGQPYRLRIRPGVEIKKGTRLMVQLTYAPAEHAGSDTFDFSAYVDAQVAKDGTVVTKRFAIPDNCVIAEVPGLFEAIAPKKPGVPKEEPKGLSEIATTK